jgi:hypothetical protein
MSPLQASKYGFPTLAFFYKMAALKQQLISKDNPYLYKLLNETSFVKI